jgi:hypothetical protein
VPASGNPSPRYPLTILGKQCEQSFDIAAAERCKSIFHNLDILLYAHRNSSISPSYDKMASPIPVLAPVTTAIAIRAPLGEIESFGDTDRVTRPFVFTNGAGFRPCTGLPHANAVRHS